MRLLLAEADKTETNARNVPIATLSNQDKVNGKFMRT